MGNKNIVSTFRLSQSIYLLINITITYLYKPGYLFFSLSLSYILHIISLKTKNRWLFKTILESQIKQPIFKPILGARKRKNCFREIFFTIRNNVRELSQRTSSFFFFLKSIFKLVYYSRHHIFVVWPCTKQVKKMCCKS